MAKSAAGKWVSRVGASGGGKAYKKSRPGNYYGALVVIVVLGLAATIFARYDYQHPAAASSKGTAPTIGTTWYAALSIEACGKTLPYLNPDPTFKGGFKIQPANVIRLSPVSSADSGKNATLSQFANEFPGLVASSSELAVPTSTGVANATTTYHNGQACPAKSKYAGQSAKISYAYWSHFGQKKPTITTNPSSIKFTQFLRVTMAFEPTGVTPKAPAQVSVNAMVLDAQSAPATTTTTVPAFPTTTSASTTTTIKSTTTTAAG